MRQLSEQEERRREELRELGERGIQAYPYAWDVSAHAAEIFSRFDDDRHQPSDDGLARTLRLRDSSDGP